MPDDPDMRDSSVSIREGAIVAVPVRGGDGRGVGVIARYSAPLGVGYFFWLPDNADNGDFKALEAQTADLICHFADEGIHDGSWPIVGELPGFCRQAWPLPAFGQDLFTVGLIHRYSGDDMGSPLEQTKVPLGEISGLPRMGCQRTDYRNPWSKRARAHQPIASCRMLLAEVIERLQDLGQTATIYAQKPWTAGSRCVVAVEPEDGSLPAEARGLDYFLEVDLALEARTVGTAGTSIDRVIYYATHDAYLFAD